MVYKNMVEILDAINHKLSGQYVRFTVWFGTVLIYNMIWNGFDLRYDLKRFWFTVWFEAVLIYDVIWNGFDLQHELEQFWFTTWIVVHISDVPQTNVLGTCQTVYIDTMVIPDRLIWYLSNKILLLVF